MYSKVFVAASIVKPKFEDYENLKFDDILCVVCLTILKEPVFLPCDHGFCLNCFELIVQKNDLNCPCCRKRFATWLRKTNSTSATPGGSGNQKADHLVDKKLWAAIQKQFADHLNEDERSLEEETPGFFTPPESFQISQQGEIRKDFETQLKQYQNELIEKEKKDNSAATDYIIDLYRQESVINLVDSPSENQSSSTSSSSSSASGSSTYSSPISDNNSNMLLAQPGPSSYHNQTRPGTSNGSIISISSTSSPASTSAASSRFSLIKSVTQQINRGTEIIKNSFLGKLTKARLKEHEKSNHQLLNKNVMTVEPTKIHRAPSHCSSDGNDSLKSDTNYFKPILPSPTKSFVRPLLRVPSVKVDPTESPSGADQFRPTKSRYQLLSPITLKKSAFSIVNQELACEFAEQLRPPAPSTHAEKETVKNEPNRRGRKRKNTNSDQSVKQEAEKPPVKVSKMAKLEEVPTSVRVTRRSNYNNFNNNSGEKLNLPLNCDITDPKKAHILQEIMLDQRKCEAMIEQERKDFEYAKKLQSQLNRQQRTPKYLAKYSLRRKSNLQNEDNSVQMGDCRKAVQVVERMGTRRSARNKC